MSMRTQRGKLCATGEGRCAALTAGLTWVSHSEHKGVVLTWPGVHKMRPLNTLSGREEELMGPTLPKDLLLDRGWRHISLVVR